MQYKPLPSVEYLSSWLTYDAGTGEIRRRRRSVGSAESDSLAGTIDGQGYRVMYFFRARLSAHRVAWKMFYGRDPHGQIDHINGNRADNRIANLRIATQQQNCANRAHHKNNRIGLKGVRREGANYSARIMVKGKAIHIGMFRTADAAHSAYLMKAREMFGEFASGRRERA